MARHIWSPGPISAADHPLRDSSQHVRTRLRNRATRAADRLAGLGGKSNILLCSYIISCEKHESSISEKGT